MLDLGGCAFVRISSPGRSDESAARQRTRAAGDGLQPKLQPCEVDDHPAAGLKLDNSTVFNRASWCLGVHDLPARRRLHPQVIAVLRAALPDLHAVIHDQIAEGDKVVTRKTFYGTHRGEFAGVPPTGKEVAIDAIDIVRIANGQVVDHWAVTDVMGFMQQVGAVPLPPSAAAG